MPAALLYCIDEHAHMTQAPSLTYDSYRCQVTAELPLQADFVFTASMGGGRQPVRSYIKPLHFMLLWHTL